MTTPTTRRSQGTRRRPWLAIAVEALLPLVGRTVSLGTLYAAIEEHPDARIRARTNDVRWGIDDAIWKLEQAGLLNRTEGGRWEVHRGLDT